MSDYTTDWHLLIKNQQRLGMPHKSNVYCLNGSAHIRSTTHRCATTCPKCIRIYEGKSTVAKEAQKEREKCFITLKA
jgi:hypothetical protein